MVRCELLSGTCGGVRLEHLADAVNDHGMGVRGQCASANRTILLGEERADHGFRDRYLAQVFEERIDRLLDLRMIPVVTHPVAVTVAAEQMHGVFIASVVMLPVAGASIS